jgi:hypothetical protein
LCQPHGVSDPDVKFGGSYFNDFTDNSKDTNFNISNSNASKPSKISSDSSNDFKNPI